MTSGLRVLAFAIDAAEPRLVRELLARGELPALAALLDRGQWLRVESPARIGSGSVWPTFISGREPADHGVYGEWAWHPATMSVRRYHGRDLVPFWKALVERRRPVGILDLPFMPLLGLADGFEVSEWGPHDVIDGRLQVSPPDVVGLVASAPAHPLAQDRLDAWGPGDLGGLRRLARQSLDGIWRRGDLAAALLREKRPALALIAFTEIHHAGHHLWHTIDRESAVYAKPAFEDRGPVEPTLADLYREVDRQIGRLAAQAPADATVLAFSLHGMRPAHGVPAFLPALLGEWGVSAVAAWRGLGWRDRARATLAAAKRWAPPGLKRAYYRAMAPATTHRVARASMLPSYDWPATRAFSMPTDQHGWIRINLRGREAAGLVPPREYDALVSGLADRVRGLRTAAGARLVRDVFRTAASGDEAQGLRLPDLVVHWEDAVFAAPQAIAGSAVKTAAIGTKFSGQHSLEGFCIVRGPGGPASGAVRAADLGRLMASRLAGPG